MPLSAIVPCSRTTIRLARLIVDRRWAMTIAVRPASSRSRPCSIRRSVRTSTFEVASSRIRIRGSASSARAKATICRSPADSDVPRSPTSVSTPSARPSISGSPPTVCSASRMSSALGVRAAEGDVLGDRAAEQEALLGDDPEPAAQRVRVELADVDAVDQDPPALRVVEAGDQLRQRRLAGAGLADQRDRLAGQDPQVDVA